MDNAAIIKSLSPVQLLFVQRTQAEFDKAVATIKSACDSGNEKMLDKAIADAASLTSDARTAKLQADFDRANAALEAHRAALKAKA